jgi:HPt (histidine-containing phosphotransfer) domain-containing protein
VNVAPVIDGGRLQSICAGERELAVELIEALIEEAQPLVTSATELTQRCAHGELRETAHALNGIAGNIGAVRLQAAAAALETAAAPDTDHDWAGIAGFISEVECALDGVRTLHAAWIDAPGGAESVFATGA